MDLKRIPIVFLAILLLPSIAAGAVFMPSVPSYPAGPPGPIGYASDRIVVRFGAALLETMDRRSLASGRSGIPDLDHLGVRHGVVSVTPLFPGADEKARDGRAADLAGWHRVRFAGPVDAARVAEEYKGAQGVIEARPVGLHRVWQTPNDTWYAPPTYQWHLPKIMAPEAWDIHTGNPSVVIAILDTGVRYFHPDLGGSNASYANPGASEGNMWINADEKVGFPGVDDDNNGYVDDWIGWDFVASTADPLYQCMQSMGEDCSGPDNDPRDFHGHGTHVSGIASALSNNGYGVASPAGGWGTGVLGPLGDGVRIMPLRIGWSVALFGVWEVGVVAMDYAAEALFYAANNGARIASCSWGSDDTGGLPAAIDYFVGLGGLVFKAAGNDGTETADYMGGRADVINVAATDQQDCKASFSNFGDWVDVSAPGVKILSLFHNQLDPGNEYVTEMDGTSMAAPLAASVGAMIWYRNPGWTAAQVRQKLFESADPIDEVVTGTCGNSPYAGKLGAGRVNAFRAVEGSPSPPPPEIGAASLKTGRLSRKTKTFAEATAFTQGEEVVFSVEVVRDDNSPVQNATATIAISGPAATTVTSDPTDTDGIAYARWKTTPPKGTGRPGTPAGNYSANVSGLTATGVTWDGAPTAVNFTVTPK